MFYSIPKGFVEELLSLYLIHIWRGNKDMHNYLDIVSLKVNGRA